MKRERGRQRVVKSGGCLAGWLAVYVAGAKTKADKSNKNVGQNERTRAKQLAVAERQGAAGRDLGEWVRQATTVWGMRQSQQAGGRAQCGPRCARCGNFMRQKKEEK